MMCSHPEDLREPERLYKKADKLVRGCVVFMKASSNLPGYGNGQCVSEVHEQLFTIALYGHNQHYKISDIDRIVEYPIIEKKA